MVSRKTIYALAAGLGLSFFTNIHAQGPVDWLPPEPETFRLLNNNLSVQMRVVHFDPDVIDQLDRESTAGLSNRDLVSLWRTGEGRTVRSAGLTMPSGVNAGIQQIREIIYPVDEISEEERNFFPSEELRLRRSVSCETRPEGISFNITPTDTGHYLNLILEPEMSRFEGNRKDSIPGKEAGAPIFSTERHEAQIVIEAESTQAVRAVSTRDGKTFEVVFLSVHREGIDGKPTALQEKILPRAPAAVRKAIDHGHAQFQSTLRVVRFDAAWIDKLDRAAKKGLSSDQVVSAWRAGKGETLTCITTTTSDDKEAVTENTEEIMYPTGFSQDLDTEPVEEPQLRWIETRQTGNILNTSVTPHQSGRFAHIVVVPEQTQHQGQRQDVPRELRDLLPIFRSRRFSSQFDVKLNETIVAGSASTLDGKYRDYLFISVDLIDGKGSGLKVDGRQDER